jgi:hypothetical protein
VAPVPPQPVGRTTPPVGSVGSETEWRDVRP